MKQQIKKVMTSGLKKVCLCCVPAQRDKMLPYAQAEQILRRHSPDPGAVCPDRTMECREYDLSVLVPVYAGDEELKQCLDSVFSQDTGFRYEVIVLERGFRQEIPEAVEQYGEQENLRLVRQSCRSVSGAQRRGLPSVRGSYVMFLDPRDRLSEGSIEALLGAAAAGNPDILRGRGKESTVWGRIYRTELLRDISFPESYWFEDPLITGFLNYLSDRAEALDRVVYERNREEGSREKPGSIDTFYMLRSVLEARQILGLPTDSGFYEQILLQMIQCIRRSSRDPERVRKSIFTLFQKLLQEQRCLADIHLGSQYDQLEELLLQGDYRKFRLLCALW